MLSVILKGTSKGGWEGTTRRQVAQHPGIQAKDDQRGVMVGFQVLLKGQLIGGLRCENGWSNLNVEVDNCDWQELNDNGLDKEWRMLEVALSLNFVVKRRKEWKPRGQDVFLWFLKIECTYVMKWPDFSRRKDLMVLLRGWRTTGDRPTAGKKADIAHKWGTGPRREQGASSITGKKQDLGSNAAKWVWA
jgi:hypothetical protein